MMQEYSADLISRREISECYGISRGNVYLVLRGLRPVKLDPPYLWEREKALEHIEQWLQKYREPRKARGLCYRHKCSISDVNLAAFSLGQTKRFRMNDGVEADLYNRIDKVLLERKSERDQFRNQANADKLELVWLRSETIRDRYRLSQSFTRRLCALLPRTPIHNSNRYHIADVEKGLDDFCKQKQVPVHQLVKVFEVSLQTIEQDIDALEVKRMAPLKEAPFVDRETFEVLWAMYENDDLRRKKPTRIRTPRDDRPKAEPEPVLIPEPTERKLPGSQVIAWAKSVVGSGNAPKPKHGHPWRERRGSCQSSQGIIYMPNARGPKFRAFYYSATQKKRITIGEYETKQEAQEALGNDPANVFETNFSEPQQFGVM
jgi:hypothetical protein